MTETETELKTVENGDTLTLLLEGEIDHHNARSIRSRVDTMLFMRRPKTFVLDLSCVSFMDSSGLGLILGRYAKANELGIAFRLTNPTAEIRKILSLAGTERIVEVVKTEEKTNGKERVTRP